MERAGFVSIVGITSVGKSSLVNTLIGEKIAIVSGKPQSTRKTMNVILSSETSQVIFVDTPGLHAPRNRLGEIMINSITKSIKGCDSILYLSEASAKPYFAKELLDFFKLKKPVDLCFTKSDLKPDLKVEDIQIPKEFPFRKVFLTSAKKNTGTEELKNYLFENMPEGPFLYPEDDITDVTSRYIVEEFIREVVCHNMKDEIPFGVAVMVDEYKERKKGKLYIHASIFCERETHKGIIIGNQGAMIKQVGQDGRKLLEEFTEQSVFLELKVKVRKNWRKNDLFLKYFGYNDK